MEAPFFFFLLYCILLWTWLQATGTRTFSDASHKLNAYKLIPHVRSQHAQVHANTQFDHHAFAQMRPREILPCSYAHTRSTSLVAV